MTAEHTQQGPPLAAKPSWYVTRVGIPSFEQRHDLTTLRVVGPNAVGPLDGIATAQGEEWVAAPFGPGLEAAEWPTGTKRRSVLATAAPDGQGCREPLSSLTLDVL